MPSINADLHGNAPDKSHVAVVLIDVINDLALPGEERLLEHALPMAARIGALKKRAKRHGIPVVYANDNFGRWRSDFNAQVEHCLADDCQGKPIAELLRPEHDDYFVLKPKHSAFFSTALDTLLTYLQTRTVILAGMAGNICVLFSANDAYMRDLKLIVPSDCIASNSSAENHYALEQMRQILKADTPASDQICFETLTKTNRTA